MKIDQHQQKIDDSDHEPNFYLPGDIEQVFSRRSPDVLNFITLSSLNSNNVLVPQSQNLDLTNDEYYTEVSSSSSDENENYDDDSEKWVNDYKSFFGFLI